ncbi:KH domain-containing protein [Fodinisporobacter ferrooxydans]|uniref:RNA-binding protein KhpA n=1 Tax=Fodinisporobacter ferrooxydans TaxID=2901836 RepID=A0ABY4CFE4_9BACL|nr:KH domain-containing protein [Alicyclobacillaceae bacterium MYW30-H2]
MKRLIEVIAQSLVDQPDQVQVLEVENDHSILYKLSVAPEDVGKVIGKQGKIAKAIRNVVSAGAVKYEKRVTLEIQ